MPDKQTQLLTLPRQKPIIALSIQRKDPFMSNPDPLADFLLSTGLKLDPQNPDHDRSSGAISNNFIAILSHYGHLAISGIDAAKFLQGQTTCDLSNISLTSSSQGSYCTVKGRMLSSFLIAQSAPESYLLRMRRELVDSTQSALSKYIVFSKAKQHNANNDLIAIGLYGDKASATISGLFGDCPDGRYTSISHQGNVITQIDADGLMFECWLKQTELVTLWPDLSAHSSIHSASQWQLLNIRLGLGEVCTETADVFIPQMLNYQLTGAISFSKGCYTGQEIVARMQYRGKLKRAMYRIKTSEAVLTPGAELYSLTDPNRSEQSIGNIVNSVSTSDTDCEALAVISHIAVEQGHIVAGVNKSPVEILTLPYTLSKDGDEAARS
jgi:folate-binding protein YgfZ